MNNGNSGIAPRDGAFGGIVLSLQGHSPGIAREYTGKNAHQGAFASPVCAQKADNLSPGQIKVHSPKHIRRSKRFADIG